MANNQEAEYSLVLNSLINQVLELKKEVGNETSELKNLLKDDTITEKLNLQSIVLEEKLNKYQNRIAHHLVQKYEEIIDLKLKESFEKISSLQKVTEKKRKDDDDRSKTYLSFFAVGIFLTYLITSGIITSEIKTVSNNQIELKNLLQINSNVIPDSSDNKKKLLQPMKIKTLKINKQRKGKNN